MTKLEVKIEQIEEKEIYVVEKKSNDLTIANDIKEISKKYFDIIDSSNYRNKDYKNKDSKIKKEEKEEKELKKTLPFYVLSKDYNKNTKDFTLQIGGEKYNEKLKKIMLPKNKYGIINVKPKFGFLWGLSIREAKMYFYTKWLPNSNYKELNMEYEYHTEKSITKRPSIDIIFAIKDKEKIEN